MSSRKSEPAVLSSARINRLLRPLRSRCISLAKYSFSQVRHTTIPAAYPSCCGDSSKHHGQFIPSALNILPQPGSLGFRQYLGSDQAEMARRIYAVRDCFQDIVINTRRCATEANSCRIQSLAALCSTVIGDNMEPNQVVHDAKERVEEEDESDSSNLMDDLYDAIPAEYRRYALLSHALRLVLSHCGDNATLLTKLLDVALDHKLDLEASLLLHSLVSLSLSSPSGTSKIPLICHPAHTNFFLDLYTQWNSSCSSNATFFRVLIVGLEASQDNLSVWSSKAVHNVAQIMFVEDFASYLRLISVSSTFVAEPCTTSIAFESEARKSLLSRISIWLKSILEWFPNAAVEYDPCGNAEAYSNDVGEMLTCMLSLICSPKTLQVPEGPEADIQGIILSLSTQWLTVRRLPFQSLVKQLSVTLPRVTTFTPLVAKVFIDSDGCLRVFRTAIQDMASTLHTFNLLHLHASLLGCTLSYIEHPSHERELAIKNSIPEIQEYRHELIELTDEAEDRFVRPRRDSSVPFSEKSDAIATPLRRELFRDISEWEPRSGSWIRKSESAKKRKVIHGRHFIPSGCDSSSALPPKSEHGYMKSRISPGHKPLFSTLLSRAASKRAILHPIQQLPCSLSVSEASEKAYQESMSDDDCQPVSFSDDALDLFAWAPSSPVKVANKSSLSSLM